MNWPTVSNPCTLLPNSAEKIVVVCVIMLLQTAGSRNVKAANRSFFCSFSESQHFLKKTSNFCFRVNYFANSSLGDTTLLSELFDQLLV